MASLEGLAAMIASLPQPRPVNGSFSLEAFILGFRADDLAGIKQQLQLIARLTRKAEVARRLYVAYAPDLRRPASYEVLSPSYAAAFCGICLAAAELLGDYRTLNCALKMLDGILLEPKMDLPPMLGRWAERLLG